MDSKPLLPRDCNASVRKYLDLSSATLTLDVISLLYLDHDTTNILVDGVPPFSLRLSRNRMMSQWNSITCHNPLSRITSIAMQSAT